MEVATPDVFLNMLRFSQETGMAVLRTQEKFFGRMLDLVSGQTAWLAPLSNTAGEELPEAPVGAGSVPAFQAKETEALVLEMTEATAKAAEDITAHAHAVIEEALAAAEPEEAAPVKSSSLKTSVTRSKRAK
jgi:hypothetical protein